MSMRITCPKCRRQLLLPSDCTAEVLSCPGCRTEIANPQSTPASTGVQAEAPSPLRESPVTPSPIIAPKLRIDDVDGDVPRDGVGTSRLRVLLPVLGGLGTAYALLLGGLFMLKDGEFWPLLIFLAVLAMFTLFRAARVADRHPRDTSGAFIGRTVLGVLTYMGAIVGVGLLLAVATLVFLLAVCAVNGGKC